MRVDNRANVANAAAWEV